MTYTKESFAEEFQLSGEDVRETLKAIGFHPNKRHFSPQERARFAAARQLLNDGAANSYEDLEAHFQADAQAGDYLRELDAPAVEVGFELGLKQGQIMGQVIPHAAVMRLKEMIATGELKENFEAYWAQAMKGGKSPQEVEAMVEECWTTYQLEKYPTPKSLPESSTPSSDSD
jgi:hypothetical protein